MSGEWSEEKEGRDTATPGSDGNCAQAYERIGDKVGVNVTGVSDLCASRSDRGSYQPDTKKMTNHFVGAKNHRFVGETLSVPRELCKNAGGTPALRLTNV